jgi:hypothetical protein
MVGDLSSSRSKGEAEARGKQKQGGSEGTFFLLPIAFRGRTKQHEKHLKIILLAAFSLVMITVLASCTNIVSNIWQDNKTDTSKPEDKKTVQTDTQPQ